MNYKYLLLSIAFLLHFFATKGQSPNDTTQISLGDVEIRGYLKPQALRSSTLSAFTIDKERLSSFDRQSLVPVFNTVPGLRMEERSPGSYRLSVRGSLLRSPFGVRDVKVYMHGMPLTDAGGNTYLNAISLTALQNVEILKGPDGSLFGANSGGVVLLEPMDRGPQETNIALGLQAGSYHSGLQSFQIKQQIGKHNLQISQSYQTSEGYRENSAMSRLYIHALDEWDYHEGKQLTAFLLYGKMNYETPGGLTQEQYGSNPKWARQGTASLPGAAEQKAGVLNDFYFGGLRHEMQLRPGIKNVFSAFGSFADFKNPFITNYETRKESTGGTRFYFSFFNPKPHKPNWEYTLGFEGQTSWTAIANYDHHARTIGDLQSKDEIRSHQYFVFNHLRYQPTPRLTLEASASVNFAGYRFLNKLKNDFRPQWMPRLAANYKVSERLALRVLASRGFSAPTTAEIRPSDNRIYPDLAPESGWNFESGFRLSAWRNRVWFDVSGFYYHLKDAIVRRENLDGTEYFINSGGTIQPGLEAFAQAIIYHTTERKFLQRLTLNGSYTLNFFRFDDYRVKDENYTGNAVTGVPKQVLVLGLNARSLASFGLDISYNFTDRIPLNDANTVYGKEYHLLAAKVSKTFSWLSTSVQVFVSADNLLNQKYSLGNDLNAFGGRYFNAAPLRSFSVGVFLER